MGKTKDIKPFLTLPVEIKEDYFEEAPMFYQDRILICSEMLNYLFGNKGLGKYFLDVYTSKVEGAATVAVGRDREGAFYVDERAGEGYERDEHDISYALEDLIKMYVEKHGFKHFWLVLRERE